MAKTIKSQLKNMTGLSLNEYYKRINPELQRLEFNNEYQRNMLKCMVNAVDNDYVETPETNSKALYLEQSKEGFVRIPSIKGNSVLIDGDGDVVDTPSPSVEIENCKMVYTGTPNTYFSDSFTGTIHSNGYISYTATGNYKNFFIRKEMFNVKPNTLYTFIIDILENTIQKTENATDNIIAVFGDTYWGDMYETYWENNKSIGVRVGDIGIVKKVLRTRDDFSNVVFGDRGFINSECISGTFKFRWMILEGDWTNKKTPEYFEGTKTIPATRIKSVAEDEENQVRFKAVGKNLLKINDCNISIKNTSTWYDVEGVQGIYNPNVESRTSTWFYLEEGYYKFNKEEDNALTQVIDTNENIILNTSNTLTNLIPSGYYCIRLRSVDITKSFGFKNAYFYYNPTPFSNSAIENYEPYKENTANLQLSEPLRRISDTVYDEIVDNKVIRRVGCCVLDGSEDIRMRSIGSIWNKENTNTFILRYVLSNQKISDDIWGITTPLKTSHYAQVHGIDFRDNIDYPSITSWDTANNGIMIRDIFKSIDDYKTYLASEYEKGTPITILYELAEPTIEEINTDNLLLQSYGNTTMYLENTVTPFVKHSYPASIAYKESLQEQQTEVVSNTEDVNENILPYLMEMEYNLMTMDE